MNKCAPQVFMCHTPIIDTNCNVMMIPMIIGTKSPMCLIDGVKSIGNASSVSTIAVTESTLNIFGLWAFIIYVDVSTKFF